MRGVSRPIGSNTGFRGNGNVLRQCHHADDALGLNISGTSGRWRRSSREREQVCCRCRGIPSVFLIPLLTREKAIDWAMEHKVDTICIPWGLPKEKMSIFKAIRKARQAEISVFARGPSYRNEILRSFPANSFGNHSFAISASNSAGAAMEETSRYIDQYFHALGVAVPGANTSHKGKGKEPLRLEINKDGHSVATCVATGLAAMWVGYIRAYMDADTKVTATNMHDFLTMMYRTATDVYPGSWLTPWSVFGQNRDTKRLIKCLLKWPGTFASHKPLLTGCSTARTNKSFQYGNY